MALTEAAIAAALDALDPASPAVDYTRTAEKLRVELRCRIGTATSGRDVAGLVLLLEYTVPATQVAALMDVTKQHLLHTVKPRAQEPLPAMSETAARRRVRRDVATIVRLTPLLERARAARTAGVRRILVAAHGAVANKDIADETGVGRGTVNTIRRDAERAGLIPATRPPDRRTIPATKLAAVPDETLAAEAARRWPDGVIPGSGGQVSAVG